VIIRKEKEHCCVIRKGLQHSGSQKEHRYVIRKSSITFREETDQKHENEGVFSKVGCV